MGKIPEGQSKRGFPAADMHNDKTNDAFNSIGTRGATDGTEQGGPSTSVATKRDRGQVGGKKDAGSPSGIPDSSKLTGYVEESNSKGGGRSTRNTGANRQRFGIDPGRNKLG